MNQPRFRIVHSDRADRELDMIAGTADPKRVSVPFAKMMPLLVKAANENRTWLNDFSGEMIDINADLYEVLLAYGEMSRDATTRRAA